MASCPRCGFDLTAGGVCPVCGYGTGEKAHRHVRSPGGGPRRRRVLWIASGALGLAVAAGALLIVLGAVAGPGRGAQVMAADGAQAKGEDGTQVTLAAPAQAKAAGGTTAVAPPAFDLRLRREHPPLDDQEAFVAWMLKHSDEEETFLRAKWERAQEALARGDIVGDRLLEAFLRTPRQYFCRQWNLPRAYADAAMSIGYGQTISGPHLVTRMTSNLDVRVGQRVLEIGTGSGYQSALLAELSDHVFTIEIVAPLAQQADAVYARLQARYPEYGNIRRKNADGYYGWEEHAPFDRIIVTAGIDHIPPALLKQLSPGGIMVIPVGPPSGQTVLKLTKQVSPDGQVTLSREDIYHGRRSIIFVPFTSDQGGVHSLQSKN